MTGEGMGYRERQRLQGEGGGDGIYKQCTTKGLERVWAKGKREVSEWGGEEYKYGVPTEGQNRVENRRWYGLLERVWNT